MLSSLSTNPIRCLSRHNVFVIFNAGKKVSVFANQASKKEWRENKIQVDISARRHAEMC